MSGEIPIQGTFFKSEKATGGKTGTWVNVSTSLPFFPVETKAFQVGSSKKIDKADKLQITKETLERLAITRPEHKQPRERYDKTNLDHLIHKNNKIQTAEDDIHIELVDT